MQRKYQFFGVAMAAFALLGCGVEQPSAPQSVEQARQSLNQGDDDAAVIHLKSALQLDANNAETRYLLGTLYQRRGDFAAAEKELRRALDAGYRPHAVTIALAETLLGLGEFKRVIDEVALPDDATAQGQAHWMVLRGNAYLGLRQPDEARKLFEQARAISADSSAVYLGLAGLAAYEGDLDRALAQVDRALLLAPKDRDALLVKADLLRVQPGQILAALAAYRAVLAVEPNHLAALLGSAAMLAESRQIDAARAAVEAARKIKPDALNVQYMQALVAYRGKQLVEARERLQEILRGAPDHVQSLLLSGSVNYDLGAFQQAASALRKVLDRIAGPEPRMLLAATLLQLDQHDEALAILAPLQPELSNDAKLLSLAGNIHLTHGNRAVARSLLARAAALQPEDAGIRTGLAISRLAQGDAELALADLAATAAKDTHKNAADLPLVMMLMRQGEFDQALSAIDRLQQKMPNSPVPHNLRGGAYMGKKALVEARASFERALAIQPDYYSAAANLAQLDLQANQLVAAKRRFQTLLQSNPGNVPSMLALADIARLEGKHQDTVAWLEKAARAEPENPQPRMLLASHYLARKDPAKALALATEAQVANPADPAALELLAAIQLLGGSGESALSSYRKLVDLTPKSPSAWVKLANVQQALGQTRAAQSSFDAALKVQPDFVDAQVGLAALALKAGRWQQAAAMARRIQQTSPMAAKAWELEGDALMSEAQPARAPARYDKAWQLEKSGVGLVKWHRALTRSNQAAAGDSRLREWVDAHPQDRLSRLYLAESSQQRGNFAESNRHYAVLLKQVPNDVSLLNNYAWGLHRAGDAQALAFAERAHRLAPDSPAVMDTLAAILVDRGDARRGLQLLQRAIAQAPKSTSIAFNYAQALAKTGDSLRARNTLEFMLAQNADFPQAAAARELLRQLKSGKG